MTSNAVTSVAPKALLALTSLTFLAASLYSPLSQAQQVYRIVGPDGKVTFSDQPPPATANAKVGPANTGAAGAAAASTGLPFELRQVATKYPVTLYTGENCSPCAAARNLLTSRGVPFTEKTVTTNEDIQSLQRLSGGSSLPFGTIGSQQMKGFSELEWTQFLNAAGYPATSVLPASYRPPAASPLVTVNTPPPAAAGGGAARPAAAAPPPPVAPVDNPSGIKF
ncbi:Glutaredoxin [Polaromonas sp. YR568]|uniref:glutaredoxin family protein n=1 Tax=Polaromonas sp. YR568 TaxID=1855301 RepID=UPI0008E3B769|nr:glutaredoxin family protein [Polaromonas sp. YR568]SFU32848.1 Glutaredoxin [Polaromonas sp. YR568]